MKTLQLVRSVGVVVAATLLICACKAVVPTIVPTITLEAPEEGSVFTAGYDVHFVAVLADSLGLTSYSVQIAPKKGEVEAMEGTIPFNYMNTWELQEQKELMMHHHEVVISNDAAEGNYVFTITCTNKAQKASKLERNITIKKPYIDTTELYPVQVQ